MSVHTALVPGRHDDHGAVVEPPPAIADEQIDAVGETDSGRWLDIAIFIGLFMAIVIACALLSPGSLSL